MPLFIKTISGTLKACTDEDKDSLNRIKVGEVVEITFKKKRNYQFHKKYFALINLLFENQEMYTDIKELRNDLTIEAGFYDERVNKLTGEVIKEAHSISFAKMDETEFDNLYNKTFDVVLRIINCEREQLINELLTFA